MRSTAASRPWQPGLLKNAPLLSFALLGASIVISGVALYIVHFANDSPVDSWPIAPSVYLSILATLSGIALRSAFQEGAETYWWSLLLSESGVKLRTLHSVWELKHDALSRFKVTRHDAEPVLRTAGIVLLLMAATGPLLQRAVVVDVVGVPTNVEKTVPIRREPMWNLTAKYYSGVIPSPAAYQDEFANVATGLIQRHPMQLSDLVCPLDATCRTNVTVVGFDRVCTRSSVSLETERVPLLPDFQKFTSAGGLHECTVVGATVNNSCRYFPVDYQLEAKFVSVAPEPKPGVETSPPSPGPGELPWPGPDLFPVVINYTSYFRENSASDLLTIQRCKFTSAYINITIAITEGRLVRMVEDPGRDLSLRNRGFESIPSPIESERDESVKMLAGIEQTIQDLYVGFSIYDGTESSHAIKGLGPRQFINQSNIGTIERGKNLSNRGFKLSFRDPLDTFTNTLHELSLRYALETIDSTPEREEELNYYFDKGDRLDSPDRRERVLQAMKTMPSKSQRVTMRQTSMVAVYRTNSLFAFIAVGISTTVSVLVALLLTGWRRCGRPFSMSPLEIAKAFDAPLLRQVGSNVPAGQIARDDGGSRLRYGELKQQRRDSEANSDLESFASQDIDCEAAPRAEDDGLMEPTGARLAIDVADRIVTPVKGKIYV